jgi:Protein of unknown function (DUF3120)
MTLSSLTNYKAKTVIIDMSLRTSWLVFLGSAFLVTVPVFFQAPLVRSLPWLSLVLTLGWLAIAYYLYQQEKTRLWGDLLFGFSWSWLAGSIYWGWLRFEPTLHLPVEAIGLPFAGWCLYKGWGKIGNWFYLGSLFGTTITDLYFYLTDVIPDWRELMQVDPAFATPILQNALLKVETLWGFSWALILLNLLLVIGIIALHKKQLETIAFGGAVLSTILVDGLFWLVASFA